jgi:C4-dicarboxylate transporter
MNQMPPEILSNIVSIILVVILVVSYLRHKKRIDVIKKLDELKTEKKLTQEDKNYITQNEKEYKEKSEKTEIFAKFLTPVFILISGILFIYLPLTEAMIHFNVIIVAIIYVQLNRINKKNTYILLKELKKDA